MPAQGEGRRLDRAGLVGEILARAEGRDRFIVAVAGPPGSGKTTLAHALVGDLGPAAVALPMDGFHFDNARLEKMGLLARKGAPETFDAAGFVALLHRVRRDREVPFPTFDRVLDSTVPGGGCIGPETRIVVVEGNYLFLETPPWADLWTMFDLTVGLDVGRETLQSRLIARWIEHGLPPMAARKRALGNDMANVDFVAAHSRAPEFLLGG